MSVQTSGGTCLSTNWGEVSEKDYEKERTAPDGTFAHPITGERLVLSEMRKAFFL